jgi:hypothetical protein
MSWNDIKEKIKPVYGLINFGETRELAKASFEYIQRDKDEIQKNYIRTGFHLAECKDMKYYQDFGYDDFYEFVDKNFQMEKTKVSRRINVFMAFSQQSGVYQNSHLTFIDDRYANYSCSALEEMLSLDEKKRQQIKPEMTIKQIRELKKQWSGKTEKVATSQQPKEIFCTSFPSIVCNIEEIKKKHFIKNGNIEGCAGCCICCTEVKTCKYVCGVGLYTKNYDQLAEQLSEKKLEVVESINRDTEVESNIVATSQLEEQKKDSLKKSAYGTTKRVYPEDSLLSEGGCEGDHCCFDCSMDCEIRQLNCYCREAPLGNPFDCTTVHVIGSLRLDIGDKCQFVNHDLAYHRLGDKSPAPCCKSCENADCGYRCNRSGQHNYEKEQEENIVQTVEYQEVKQPELPVLKNNDQRKEFIDSYKNWPVWIDQQLTGEKYYRYNLTDKVAIVVKVSRKHVLQGYKEANDYEYGAEQYYLIGIKTEWSQKGTKIIEDETRTFYECNTNKSALVDYLKVFQKK